jgi:zinc protease
MVPMIPVEGVNEMMKEFLPQSDSNMVILNFNNEKEGNVYPTEAQLLGAVKAAREAQIEAYVDNVKNEPLIKELPKAGTIKKETRNEKLGYTSLQLSNGVKVNLKQTDYKKDQVLLSGTGGGGSSLYGEPDYVNLKTFNDVIGISGLGNFSTTELQKALAGKIANADLMMSERRMAVSGNSTPKDVETMLQMVYLYFTNIRKDPDAFHNLTQQYDVALKNRSLSPETAVSDSLTATLYDHSKRVTPLLQADIAHIDYDRILALAKERTASAQGWTFNLVGNFDEATIRRLVCQYLGALPAKGKAESSKRVNFITKQNVENKFTRKMETPKAMAYMVWYNEQLPFTLEGDIQADMAGQVLSMVYLKQIREEASAAYTCGAYASSSVDDDGSHSYTLIGVCPMKPEKWDIALKIMSEEAVKMGTACDAEMLNKVKAAMLKNADDRVKTNTYWNNIIGTYERVGLDNHTDYKRLVEAQTPQSVSAFMKKFLETGNKVSVIMLPQE